MYENCRVIYIYTSMSIATEDPCLVLSSRITLAVLKEKNKEYVYEYKEREGGRGIGDSRLIFFLSDTCTCALKVTYAEAYW